MSKTAIVTGITGQDGAYLAELLLGHGYNVIGTYRRSSSLGFWRLEYLGIATHNNLTLACHDLTDLGSSIRLLEKYQPDEVYNLAAQSFVGISFDEPIMTTQITGLGPVHLLEAIRIVNTDIRFYQASTSEMFGRAQAIPQDESTPFHPRSPYGAAKLYAHWMTVNYREAYGIFGASGILFNHESPLRGLEFVTRKITDAVARIKTGKLECVCLGNLDAKRDWGFAKDYVDGMWRMLQADQPDTYVLATNRTESVRKFVELSFKAIGEQISWQAQGVEEIGYIGSPSKVVVRIDPQFYRAAEVDILIGDASKARETLGWEAKTGLEDLCLMMVNADLKRYDAQD